jgi:hypothetical protein
MPAHCPAVFVEGDRHVREALDRAAWLFSPVNAVCRRLFGGRFMNSSLTGERPKRD